MEIDLDTQAYSKVEIPHSMSKLKLNPTYKCESTSTLQAEYQVINVRRDHCSINKAIQDELLAEMDEETESESFKEPLRDDLEDI
uniref:Uncharacterized protein n=1 Tax=Acrobeloides nanus TaxID=290746 RepID=A0A914D3U1_9BILA